MSEKRLLIAEDDPGLRALLTEVLQRQYEVKVVSDGSHLEEQLALGQFDLVISDLNLPFTEQETAPMQIDQLCVGNCGIFFGALPTLVITGFGPNHPQVIHAREMPNVCDVLFKPVKIKMLLTRIVEILNSNNVARSS